MKTNKLILFVLFPVLTIVLLIYFFSSSSDDEKHFSWNENYKTTSKDPYGTLFIKELLKEHHPGEAFIFNDTKPLKDLLNGDSISSPTDYVFIGKNLYLDEGDKEALLTFINRGNNAFIATTYLPFTILDTMYVNECDRDLYMEEEQLLSTTFNFYHEALHTEKGYRFFFRKSSSTLGAHDWKYVTNEVFCDSTKAIVPLGYQEKDHVNFLKVPYGRGNLFVHTNPIAFTNYFISKPENLKYTEGVLSHLDGRAIIWDEYSKLQFLSNEPPSDSPLSYFLRHKSLKYAWWMLLGTACLYTLFAAKRKQRSIPVIEGKINTSLAFVKMISALHFQNRNNMDIARKKMKYFLYFIRAKYGIHAQPFTESHKKRLAEKSKIDLKEIEVIFNEYNQIERNLYQTPAEDRLVTLYNAIDHFYRHCK